jgi:alpha-tubulin suppressor-like RCC1 family protein
VHARRVACGAFHTLISSPDGQIWAWGSNHYGQLGVGRTNSNMFRPHACNIPQTEVCDVSCGPDTSLAISSNGLVFVWGMLMSANGDRHQYQPRRLSQVFESNLFISRAAMGKFHMALVADTAFTKLLRNAVNVMSGKLETSLSQIKRDMLLMP